MQSRRKNTGLRTIATLLLSLVGTNCALGGLIVVDLASPIEASLSSSPADPESPLPQDPCAEQQQSFAGEPVTQSSSSAVSAWLSPSIDFLSAEQLGGEWFRDKGNVHSKIIPFDLLRPPQA